VSYGRVKIDQTWCNSIAFSSKRVCGDGTAKWMLQLLVVVCNFDFCLMNSCSKRILEPIDKNNVICENLSWLQSEGLKGA
jgi:hypothetical protein